MYIYALKHELSTALYFLLIVPRASKSYTEIKWGQLFSRQLKTAMIYF